MTDQAPSDDDFNPADPIVAAWADQGEADGAPYLSADPTALADSVAKAHRKDQRRMLWVNVREVVAALFVVGVYGSFASDSEHLAATLAAAILVLAVGCFLVGSSIRHHRADRRWGTSIRDQLARRLAQLNHAAWMYRNLAWCYYLPLMLAVALFWYGLGGGFDGAAELAFWGILIAMFVVMYSRARKHGRTHYESDIERLESLLAEFDRTV